MDTLQTIDAINAVSSYALILSGLLALLLCWMLAPQPYHWQAVYAGLAVAGVIKAWYHGTGETGASIFFAGMATLWMLWLIQWAVLKDFYSERTGGLIASASALVIVLLGLVWVSLGAGYRSLFVWPGMHIGQVVLALNVLLTFGLYYAAQSRIVLRARQVLYLVAALLGIGALFSIPDHREIGYSIVAYHAIWHLLVAFAFIALWASNHIRLHEPMLRTGTGPLVSNTASKPSVATPTRAGSPTRSTSPGKKPAPAKKPAAKKPAASKSTGKRDKQMWES